MLPVMDGYALLEQINLRPRNRFVSSLSNGKLLEVIMRIGFEFYYVISRKEYENF